MKTCPVCATEYPDDVRFCPNDGQTLRSSSPGRDLVGQVVADRYHVLRKLGEGGMGQVYLAEHVKMGRKSAIKVMNPSMVHDPDAVARFNREAANASRITHPSVCAIYDFGETPEGLIYLAMEYVEGEPLTDVLEREGPLPVSRAVLLCAQVADALQAAHDLGIVHRDLKPDNIMLTRGRDGADMVKVVDFGIAKAVGGDDNQKVTKTGLVVGTPEFMSPEQLSGDKVDGRSDVYSLALVLFKTLTGALPFEASTVQETMIQRLTDEPRKLADVRPDLRFPPGLQETIDAALTRSPVDRYQSAAKFANDVAAVVGLQRGGRLTPLPSTHADGGDQTEVLDAAPASPASLTRGAPARKRPLVPIVVGAVVVLGAGSAALALLRPPQRSDGAIPSDTVARQAPVRKGVDTTTHRRSAATLAAGTPSGGVPTSGRAADAGAAQAALDMVLDSIDAWPGPLLVDSAQHIYTSAVASAVRANAAYTLAHIYVDRLKDVQQAYEWIETAVRLDPTNPSYERYRTVINRDYKR